MPNICIIGSGNGLSPVWYQAITWTNAALLSIELLGTNFSEIRIGFIPFSFKKFHLKVSSAKMEAILSGGRGDELTMSPPLFHVTTAALLWHVTNLVEVTCCKFRFEMNTVLTLVNVDTRVCFLSWISARERQQSTWFKASSLAHWSKPEAYSMNDFSIVIRIKWKFNFAMIHIGKWRLLKNRAHFA